MWSNISMRCVICFTIEKKKMLLSPKSDILEKHVGCYTTIVATTNVVIGDWFYNEVFHNKNERIYTNKGNELVLNLV
jgi:hypothetical protein